MTAAHPKDERFMRFALALGRRNLGLAWPNPSVGAVVVRDGVIVGQGATQPGGRPHAERVALDEAGPLARGATLYVTLEPCSHVGRAGPCADATIEAGVARVVSALEDPNPRVAGRGHARLEAAGIAVARGILAEEARRSHVGHVRRVTAGRPAVTLKLASTRDGYAARTAGSRLLITGEAANARVHLLRAHADAILVGIGTALADDPLLTVRLPGLEHRSAVRVVVDTELRLPPASRLADTSRHPTWVIAAEDAPAEAESRLRDRGVEVMRVGRADPPPARPGEGSHAQHGGGGGATLPNSVLASGLDLVSGAAAPSRRPPVGTAFGGPPPPRGGGVSPASLDLAAAVRLLADRGITRVFCEGGPRLAEALAGADLLDEVVLVTGAVDLAGPGLPALGSSLGSLLRGPAFTRIAIETAGPDTIETYERQA